MDLLMPESVDLKLHEDPVRGMLVQGITEYGTHTTYLYIYIYISRVTGALCA